MAAAAALKDEYSETRKKRGAARKAAYESAGPDQLRKQPAQFYRRAIPAPEWRALRYHLEARLNMLRAWRYSWWTNWITIETYLVPRRGIFINASMPTANTMIRGAPINTSIVDPTGCYAHRVCASGLMSGLCSPSRPWFKLKPALFARALASDDAQEWFEEVERRIYIILARSNFYDQTAQMFEDLSAFGTAPVLIYEDDADVIRCYTPCPGEYFIGSSSTMRVEPFYRLFLLTVSQIVEEFEIENCPADIQQLWREKGSALEQERLVAHAIEPNFPIDNPSLGDIGVVPGNFTWREAYWCYGNASDWPFSLRGFKDQPHVVPRWSVTSNDAYGRSVGMDVLPDIIQLQVETNRKAEAIEKLVRPPMLASMEMKNEPSSILPGHLTYVPSLDANKGMRPAYTVNPQIREMMEDLQAIQARIKEGFFNPLFLMMQEMEGVQPRNQMEIAERRSEKLQILGPVIERWQNEYGAPALKRVFAIMARKRLLPPIPQSLAGTPLDVEFVGMLSLAQKAAASAGLERFAQTMGVLRQADPTVDDLWSRDVWTQKYGENLFMPHDVLNSPEKVQQLRQQRAQAQKQAQDQATMAQASDTVGNLAGAGKDLSGIDVGGGLNAIQLMTGMGGGQGVPNAP